MASTTTPSTVTLASNARYYPNGALKQFTYGNGIVHTMTQNARQLPSRSTDGSVLDLATAFDQHGNVTAITDHRGGRQSRTMTYDGLDRLTGTTSPMFGTATYAYDAIDNLKQVSVSGGSAARSHWYCHDANNRLSFIRTGSNCSTSPAAIALSYDVQGNLASKNSTAYSFDYGNRLRSTAGLSYRYDAEGRRVKQDTANTQRQYGLYAKDGRLLWQRDEVRQRRIENIYLAGSLLAERSRPIGPGAETFSYVHTDALGSPVAKTNSAGAVIETSEYEPYGKLLNRPNDDRAGYTGHVMDSASGLTYMQQRYYDPQIGLFLSVDPVTAYGGDTRYFNRYWYAAGNPYKYADPDGRALDIIADIGFIAYSGYKLATEPSWTNAAALGADVVGAVVPFATGLGAGVRAAANGADAAKAVDNAVQAGRAPTGGLETRGYRPEAGERTIQGQVDKAVAEAGGNPTIVRNGNDVVRLRSSGHGSNGASATPIETNIAPNGRQFRGDGTDRPVSNRDIRELHKANDGQNGSEIRTRGRR